MAEAEKGAPDVHVPGGKAALRQLALARRNSVPPEVAQAFAARLARQAARLLAQRAGLSGKAA